MAAFLYRLGRFSARHAWPVVAAWLVLLAILGGAYAAFAGTMSSAITIPGTPTSEVTEMLEQKFPSASGGTGSIVIESKTGDAFDDAQTAAINDVLDKLADVDGVNGVINPFAVEAQRAQAAEQLSAAQEQAAATADLTPEELAAAAAASGLTEEQQQAAAAQLQAGATLFDAASEYRTVSQSGKAAIATVQFGGGSMALPDELKDGIMSLLDEASDDSLGFYPSTEISQEVPEIVGVAEIIGIVIAGIVLLIMLGTASAAVLPIASALVGVGIAATGAMALSGVIDFLSVTPVLAIMLGLAVGIDYSLFILNRHRKQLRAGMALDESIGLANGTSGNAVTFAGSTVIVALLGLNLTGIPFLALMGNVAAAAVLVAIVIATTLTPALLKLTGMRVLKRKERAEIGHEKHHKEADRPMKTGWAILRVVIATVALAVIAIPASSMRLGLPTGESEPVGSPAHSAFQVTASEFGEGYDGRLLVIATLPQPVTDEATTTLAQAQFTQVLMARDDVRAVVAAGASDDGTLLAYQVIPFEGANAESTVDLVHSLRDASPMDVDGTQVEVGVAGSASAAIDVSQRLADVLPLYLSVVVGLSLIILIIAFRSIFVPLIASLGFVLSLFATFGGLTAIYQWGWLAPVFDVTAPGPILSFLPVITIGILFGLAMDYQLFISAGMREAYSHGASARVAVVRGFHAGRSVVAAAAIIMISVFGGFIFADANMIRAIGFGLAFGVLVDAFVVRMTIIPAAMHLLGDKAWWIPKWLDKILPNADIEGTQLEREHPVPAAQD